MTCKFTWIILFKKLLPYAPNGSNLGLGIGDVIQKKKIKSVSLLHDQNFLKAHCGDWNPTHEYIKYLSTVCILNG